jgi:hypothetical protein
MEFVLLLYRFINRLELQHIKYRSSNTQPLTGKRGKVIVTHKQKCYETTAFIIYRITHHIWTFIE